MGQCKSYSRTLSFLFLVFACSIQLASATCNDYEFECNSGQCIRYYYRCDLDRDCSDGSDEDGCDDLDCTDDFFRCRSGRCIPKAFVCDMEDDCHDNSDEGNCSYSVSYGNTSQPSPTAIPTSRGNCDTWQFQCQSGICIRGSYQCDDDKDCADGSDEFGCEPCVSTQKLEIGKSPFCKVRVYKGSTRIRNETLCVQENVFRVKPGRLIPYDRRIYNEPKVNYIRFTCESYYPVDFNFDGVGSIEQLRVTRSQKIATGISGVSTIYTTDVTTVATPQATGHFIFTEIHTTSTTEQPKATSLFFYFDKPKKPFLLGRERLQKAKKQTKVQNGVNEIIIILPCVAAKPNVSVYLYKESNETWSKVESSAYTYNPLTGFILKLSSVDTKKYRCTTDETFISDSDIVTVVIDEDLLTPSAKAIEPNLKIVLENKDEPSATCHSIRSEGQTISEFEFKNIYADNPLEARVLAECVLRGTQSCGSYPHVRNHHPTTDAVVCRHENQKTNCTHISEIYQQGILVCRSDSEYLVQQYFTGLDGRLYKDWRIAPKTALLKLELPSSTNTSISGMSLASVSTKCASVSMVFSRTAINFESKSAGTDVVSKHSNGAYQSWSVTLKENMTELLCSDHIWETNEEVWSEPLNVTVTPRVVTCSFLEFRCDSGQCVRASFKCDRDRDCLDGSDEANCPTTTTTTIAPVTCSSIQFSCHKSTYSKYSSTSSCIPVSYKCDGDRDCAFGEDEDNCPTTIKTTTTTTTTTTTEPPNGGCGDLFKCNNGDCIRASYKCDGQQDCKDSSDESPIADCPKPSTTTTTTTPTPTEAITHSPTTNHNSSDAAELNSNKPQETASASSAFSAWLIVFGVILLVAALSFVVVKIYQNRRGTRRGIASSSNIKYSNPTCDQEEVLIG